MCEIGGKSRNKWGPECGAVIQVKTNFKQLWKLSSPKHIPQKIHYEVGGVPKIHARVLYFAWGNQIVPEECAGNDANGVWAQN